MMRLKVGVDSYSLKPLGLTPFQTLDWAVRHGAQGVQFSEGWGDTGSGWDKKSLQSLGGQARDNGLFLEWGGAQHLPLDPFTGHPKDIVGPNRTAAEQAAALGVKVVRSCSSGLMRWRDDSVPTDTLLAETARSLREQRPMLEDLGIILALETHFEFTTFELLRLFEMCGAAPGGCLGVCLDTMNLLTMLEDPVPATRRILPWVVTTHIKDGALIPAEEGLMSFTAQAGQGLVDLEKIIFLLTTLQTPPHLSLEDHAGSFLIPVNDPVFRSKFPDLDEDELRSLVQLADRGRRFVDQGRLSILERSRWHEVCEMRVEAGLDFIKFLVRKIQ
jgi:sugar phosphate isomerase/epimerase